MTSSRTRFWTPAKLCSDLRTKQNGATAGTRSMEILRPRQISLTSSDQTLRLGAKNCIYFERWHKMLRVGGSLRGPNPETLSVTSDERTSHEVKHLPSAKLAAELFTFLFAFGSTRCMAPESTLGGGTDRLRDCNVLDYRSSDLWKISGAIYGRADSS